MQPKKSLESYGPRVRVLTIDQAAERLAVAPVTIRAWCARRQIASVKLGRARRIPESEIRRLLVEGYTPAILAAE